MEDFPQDPRILVLAERHPRLFRGRPPEVWSDLPPGWLSIVDRLMSDIDAMLTDAQAAQFKVEQIKEKFAGLRVYWSLGKQKTLVADVRIASSVRRIDLGPEQPTAAFEQIRARVAQAARDASTTCQECGAGNATAGGASCLSTLCPACRARQHQASADL